MTATRGLLARGWAPAALALGTFALGLAGILLTRQAGNVASVWLGNAGLVAALVASPVAAWRVHLPAFMAGNVAANLAVGDPLWIALGFALINAAEGLAAARLIRLRCDQAPNFERLQHIRCFTVGAGLAGPALAATLGAGFIAYAFGGAYLQVWPTWFVGDALGNMTLGPLLLIAHTCRLSGRPARPFWGSVAHLWPLALVLGVTLGVFAQSRQPTAFLILPVALVATLRLGPPGAALSAMIVTLVGGIATAFGHGPMILGAGGMAAHATVLQLLIAAVLVSSLPLAALHAERMALEARLTLAASTDSLTGLLNRGAFMAALDDAIRLARATGGPLSVALLDVDRFKRINDLHGHAVGDAALRLVASRLGGTLRGGDRCARFGGEEFVVLLPGTDLAGALAASEAMRAAVGATTDDGALPPITISVGAAELRGDEDEDRLLSRADRALYAAKAAGRDRVQLAA